MGVPGIMKRVTAAVLIILMTFVVACSGSNDETGESPTGGENNATEQKATATATATAEEQAAVDGPFGKFDPPVEVTTVREVLQDAKYPKGDSIDFNVWTRAYESELGIKMKNLWVVNNEQYEQKMNVSIIAGDLPDIFMVDGRQLQMLVEGGQVLALDELYEKYASPLTKQALGMRDGLYLKAATFKGELMAIPNLLSAGGPDTAHTLWVRTDWLNKLQLPEPKTMGDVVNIAKAFATEDPDGDKKKNSFGLVMNKDLFAGYAGLEGFFNGYNAYPRMWIKDSSGKLVYGSIQPEMKLPLKQLQDLYKAGAIDPEFAVYDVGKSAEAAVAGKAGMSYGAFYNAMWPLGDSQKTNPEADWGIFPIPSESGAPAKSSVAQFAPKRFYAINAKSKNPEAAFLMLNFYMEKLYGENAEPAKYHSVTEGDENIGLFGTAALQSGSPQDVNQIAHEKVVEALKAKDPSKLNAEERSYYDNILKYEGGDKTFWNIWKTFGEGGVFDVLGDIKTNNWLMYNEFYGSPTDTMAEKDATLNDLELNFITKLIIGDEDVDSAFDKFVGEWNSLGGEQITKEINDWHTSIQ